MLDFHNHLIPQVDDGAESIGESEHALATMQGQGIGKVITTPHLRASLLKNEGERDIYLERVDSSWRSLSATAAAKFPDVRLERGFEILLDIPEIDLSDPRLRLAKSIFALVEFPFLSIPPHSDRVLFDIKMQGYVPIVAHPERYRDIQGDPDAADRWIRVGALLQVNAGSLLGKYGPQAERTGWELLQRGWASYVCSDYHAKGNCDTAAAAVAVRNRGGVEQVDFLFTTNPERILTSELPASVPPLQLQRVRFLDRLRNALRRSQRLPGDGER